MDLFLVFFYSVDDNDLLFHGKKRQPENRFQEIFAVAHHVSMCDRFIYVKQPLFHWCLRKQEVIWLFTVPFAYQNIFYGR